MKFLPSFKAFFKSLRMYLIMVGLLVALPISASQASGIFGGEITNINMAERVIEVGGVQYKVSPEAEIKNTSGLTKQTTNMADFEIGQYVEFRVSDGSIKSIHIFEQEQVDRALQVPALPSE
ncbi:MAG: hypothetical protein KDJ28_06090 [Candidatus Competibacteraceae bacterium]|nr:hypothetical protein [Candidatus Competibacteraceae bacterium]